MGSNFPSRYKEVQIFYCVIKWPPLWPRMSHYVMKGSQFIIASSRGPHFPHRVIKWTQLWISKIQHVGLYNLWDTGMNWLNMLKSAVFKLISVYWDKRIWAGCMGAGQRNKVMKYGGEAPESPLSMGPKRPRYATEDAVGVNVTGKRNFKVVLTLNQSIHIFVVLLICL